MNWQEILTIVIPLIALMGWFASRVEKKAEERSDQLVSLINGAKSESKQGVESIRADLKDIRNDIQSLDRRLTRLEGRFDERGHWEAKIKIEESKKPSSLS